MQRLGRLSAATSTSRSRSIAERQQTGSLKLIVKVLTSLKTEQLGGNVTHHHLLRPGGTVTNGTGKITTPHRARQLLVFQGDADEGRQRVNHTLHHHCTTVFFHEMFWFVPVSPWIMDGHIWWSCDHFLMRTDAKNLVTTARTSHLLEQIGDNPHDIHVAKGSLFREYS